MRSFIFRVWPRAMGIAIRGWCQGTRKNIGAYQQSRDTEVPVIDLDSEYQPGDLTRPQTPLDPTREPQNIRDCARESFCPGFSSLQW